MRFLILLAIGFFIGGGATVFGQQEPNYKPTRSEIVTGSDFAPFEEIKKVKNCRKSLKDCAFDAMAVHGLEGFGGPETIYFFEHQFRYKQNGKDVGVFLFSILSREEPVSTDERTRVEFVREKGVWKFVTIGNQTRCVNGKKLTAWSKESCH
jgi:hypothetical protein